MEFAVYCVGKYLYCFIYILPKLVITQCLVEHNGGVIQENPMGLM